MWVALALQVAVVASAPTISAAPAAETVAADPAVRARLEELLQILDGRGNYDATFAQSFRNAVPRTQFDAIAKQLSDALGKPTGIESITPVTPWAARVRIGYARGVLNAEIAVDPTAPHLVTGLLAEGAEPRGAQVASVEEVVRAIAALPGRKGFALATLGDAAPVVGAAHEADRPLAIGSAFKLVILAELVRSIAAGERQWSDVVTLDGSALPGGGYAQQPKGTRIALRDLAERMISVSDNSATDILLFHLGREKVEAMLPVVGMTDGAPRNVPFLGALELFKLKGVNGGALGADYLALDAAGRRRLLDGRVATTPIAAIPRDLFQDKKPVRIAELEWFASPNDLIRTMDWLRRHSEGPRGAELRAILSKNPGVPSASESWSYVGYKGGSEPGVLNMTFLLKGKDGSWHALSAGWNDPDSDVDLLKFSGLIGSALKLAAPK